MYIQKDGSLKINCLIDVRWDDSTPCRHRCAGHAFYDLNALSSPIMVRINFDILWTFIADTMYHRFAKNLRRFENNIAPIIFSKFINMPGKIIYDGNNFTIKIRKRSHTPVLKNIKNLTQTFRIPWVDNKFFTIVWTA